MKKYFNYNNTDICYYTYGSKTNNACLFLHGWATSSDLWANIFMPLKQNYYLVFIDFPPFGNSGDLKFAWSLYDYVGAVNKLISLLDLTNVSIIAHSFGFRVAILLNNNIAIKKIISICGAGIEKKPFKIKCKILFYKIKKFLVRCKLLDRKRIENNGSKDYLSLSPIMKQTFTKITNCDLTKHLKNITAKTLLLYARDDDQINVKDAVIYNKKIKNSELYIFDFGGHFLFLTQQTPVFNAVQIFLKG